jgi:hypothetical protein
MGVPVIISKCCFALLLLQEVCRPIIGNGDIASVGSGKEDAVAGQFVSASLEHNGWQEISKLQFSELVLSSSSSEN